MSDENLNKHICCDCITDEVLSREIQKKAVKRLCSYCGQTLDVIGLGDFANRVHEAISAHFESTLGEQFDFWSQDGDPVEHVISEIAGLKEEIADDIAEYLSGRFAYESAKDGVENPYGSDAYYRERNPNTLAFRYNWADFCEEIRFRERFFPDNANSVLNMIFADLGTLRTRDGRPIIREVAPGDNGIEIWRARIAESQEELKEILETPARQLGPPPSAKAASGRMNPRGIPVFYGALDKETCIAEVRPRVGCHVVSGKFDLIKPVRLLDLGALSEVYGNGSYFDPNYDSIKGRAAFLRNLVEEITRPIGPQEAESEYLPTQVVASYLAKRSTPSFDGMIFPSSQVAESGQNLVLFNDSRGAEADDLPEGSVVRIFLLDLVDGPVIYISETLPPDPRSDEQEEEKPRKMPIRLEEFFMPDYSDDDVASTLRLDAKTVECAEVTGVKYTSQEIGISRERQSYEESSVC